MYERVLFPTDGSDAAATATAHAIVVADQFDVPMHVLYVVDVTPAKATDAYSGVAVETLVAEGEKHVESVRDRAAEAGVDVSTEVVEGKPAQTIVEATTDGDVLIMGTHGRTGLDRYLIGSTTENVVRTADVPVLTVPVEDLDEE